MTPRARRAMVRAGRFATRFGHGHIGTEHLLWALAADADGLAGQLLDALQARGHILDGIERVIRSLEAEKPPILSRDGDDATVRFEAEPASNHPVRVAGNVH